MRLSEARIEFIAEQIAKTLKKKRLVAYYNRRRKLSSIIARVMIEDLAFEDKIDKEVIDIINSIDRDIPEGSAEWSSIYQQKKDELAKRYNYVY